MTTKEQNQLQQMLSTSVTKLESVVSKLIQRVMVLERENAKLKHSLARAQNSITSLEARGHGKG